MSAHGWLADTQRSYDTVAASYAELLRDALAEDPYDRAVLGLFAELVRGAGGGPVADVGCGTGRVTAYLRGLGVDVVGLDLSPGMLGQARRDHPRERLAVADMTRLPLRDSSLTGLLAWYSVIHVPDRLLPAALAHFHRALRPGGVLLLAFHVGDEVRLKTEGYGGHPMSVYVHKRSPERVEGMLRDAGFDVEARLVRRVNPDPAALAGHLVAHRLP